MWIEESKPSEKQKMKSNQGDENQPSSGVATESPRPALPRRELMFRAWDTAKEKWIDGGYGFHILGEAMLLGGLFTDYGLLELNNIVITQFTGVKDKNGVEIYEGDFIQFKHYYAHKRWWKSTSDIPAIEAEVQQQRENVLIERETVTFADGAFRLGYGLSLKHVRHGEHLVRGRGASGDYEEKFWDFEVVGNCYETLNAPERDVETDQVAT